MAAYAAKNPTSSFLYARYSNSDLKCANNAAMTNPRFEFKMAVRPSLRSIRMRFSPSESNDLKCTMFNKKLRTRVETRKEKRWTGRYEFSKRKSSDSRSMESPRSCKRACNINMAAANFRFSLIRILGARRMGREEGRERQDAVKKYAKVNNNIILCLITLHEQILAVACAIVTCT
jgi:hypothetical protein